jgi:hypothetical protein
MAIPPPREILWQQHTHMQFDRAASTSPGTSQNPEEQLQDLLATTIAQHWNAVGTCYDLFSSFPPSMQPIAMGVLEDLSVSFVSHEQKLLDCITVVRSAVAAQRQQEASTSPSGKTP